MQTYSFRILIDASAPHAPVVRVLRDADQAWVVAQAMIRDILGTNGDPRLISAILEVTDEAGEVVFELPFSEALIP